MKNLKALLATIGLLLVTLGANAGLISYEVLSGRSGNQFTQIGGGFVPDAPLLDVSGQFVFDTVDNTLTGNIIFFQHLCRPEC